MPPPLPPNDELLAQVRRIAESGIFARSPRMTRFISFAAEHAVSGSAGPLKEYVVGINVFDRDSRYDPRIDPIVRVEARRLRAKLAAYYRSAGREDPIIVEFPTGSYTPVFRMRGTHDGSFTVTVLPFAALTSAGEEKALAAGLTDELVHRLAAVCTVRAAPDESTEILLRGSVRCDADQFRIIAQCIDAGSQTYLWSEAFGCPSNRAGESRVAEAIAAKTMRLSSPTASTPCRPPAQWREPWPPPVSGRVVPGMR